jgi:uncharacterized membrane protein
MKIFTLDTSSNPDSSAKVGYTLSFTSAFFAACATVTGKWNMEHISALLMSACIFSIASIIMTIFYIPGNFKSIAKITPRGWLWLSCFTISSLLAIWLFWAGVRHIDPSLAAFLNRAEVLIAILLGMLFLGERFNKMETIGAIISILGIIVMRMTLRVEYSTGFWLVLLGSIFFGMTEFFSKMTVKHVEPIIAVYLRNLTMSILYWIIFTGGNTSIAGLEHVWLGVLALGIFGPILSRMVYMMALARLELSKVAVISQSTPIFVILIAVALLGQLPTFREIVGGLFLSIGCLIMIFARYRSVEKKTPIL